MTDYKSMKVAELQAELGRRGLNKQGKKDDLVSRLTQSDSSTAATAPDVDIPVPPPTATAAPAAQEAEQVVATPAAVDEHAAKMAARLARFGGEGAKSSGDGTIARLDAALGSAAFKKKVGDGGRVGKKGAVQEEKKKRVSVLDDPVEAEKARKRAIKFGTAAPATVA
ncbi:hypothetical protein PYCC9005_003866 [Savitreella phatthalungensis]